jgi:hypothetical protein
MQQHEFDQAIAPFYQAVENGCMRIVAVGSEPVAAMAMMTEFVISGRKYELSVRSGNEINKYRFWLGVNINKLFFITYLADIDSETAKKRFSTTFGGAEKAGWYVNYEPIPKGVAILGSCMTDADDLCVFPEGLDDGVRFKPELTKKGLFWATDICLMVQSLLRTCERENVRSHNLSPAPV